MSNKVHFSSKTEEWTTPKYLFDEINREFLLNTDVCATKENAKLEAYWSKKDNGLNQDWTGLRCWMNPPYGRDIGRWVEKAATRGADIVVSLLPADTDTRWFHKYILPENEVGNGLPIIRFIKGRLNFSDSKNSAPFPSMIVIFKRT